MARVPAPRSRKWLRWTSGLLLVAAGCAGPQVGAVAPAPPLPVPQGQARIWFYRVWEPSESLNLANIDVNGTYFGTVANGGSFYRDVAPGHYHIAPVTYNRDFNQSRDVDLAPGQQAYVKILSLRNWDGACRHCSRDTFYAWLIVPEIAQGEIARDRGV
ncbi:MAG: DUF2846 domain-containing protein [Stellaceae bacterium]|jgi:hypothetical protein